MKRTPRPDQYAHLQASYSRAEATRYLRAMNSRYGHRLARIPAHEWPPMPAIQNPPTEVWRSQGFLLMVYVDRGHERLSVLRTELASASRYRDGITWDELQRLKAECGRGDYWAVEVFPPDDEVVNVQNMRHLFILKSAPDYGWKQMEASHER